MLSLVLAGLLSSGVGDWNEPYVYDLVDYIDDIDCNYNGCDLDDGFSSAFAACEAELAANSPSIDRQRVGCVFLVPAGNHTADNTLVLDRGHKIVGRGRTALSAHTMITWSTTAFQLMGYGDAIHLGKGDGGGTAIIEGLYLRGPSQGSSITYGIEAKAPVTLRDVAIVNFDVGIKISGDVSCNRPYNANGWYISNTIVRYTNHAGVWIDHPQCDQSLNDTNGGASFALWTVGTCADSNNAKFPVDFPDCAGLIDESSIGSHHFGAGFENLTNVDFSAGSYQSCVGCYIETSAENKLGVNSFAAGTNGNWSGPGLEMRGQDVNQLKVGEARKIWIGDRATNMSDAYFLLKHPSAPGRDYIMRYNAGLEVFEETISTALGGRMRLMETIGPTYGDWTRYNDQTNICSEVVACLP